MCACPVVADSLHSDKFDTFLLKCVQSNNKRSSQRMLTYDKIL